MLLVKLLLLLCLSTYHKQYRSIMIYIYTKSSLGTVNFLDGRSDFDMHALSKFWNCLKFGSSAKIEIYFGKHLLSFTACAQLILSYHLVYIAGWVPYFTNELLKTTEIWPLKLTVLDHEFRSIVFEY